MNHQRVSRQVLAGIIVLPFIVMSGCKTTTPSQSDVTVAPLAEVRDQQRNGSCWIYGYLTALNGTIRRVHHRSAQYPDLDRYGFALEKQVGQPFTYKDYYAAIKTNGGELLDVAAIERFNEEKKAPLPSINAMVYQVYITRYAEWAKSWLPISYKGDGGDAGLVESLWVEGLIPTAVFPDGDYSTQGMDFAKALCKSAGDKCDPGSLEEMIRLSGIVDLPAAEQVQKLQLMLEDPYQVPQQFRVSLVRGRLTYPVYKADFAFDYRGQRYTRATAASAYEMPKDLDLRLWAESSSYWPAWLSGRFDSNWNSTGLAKIKNAEMVEMLAALTILNQSVAVRFSSFDLEAGPRGLKRYKPDPKGKEGHVVSTYGFFVENGKVGLDMRNSWGQGWGNFEMVDPPAAVWAAVFPGVVHDRVINVFKRMNAGKCNGVDGNMRAMAAAYGYLQYEKGARLTALGQRLYDFVTRCEGGVE